MYTVTASVPGALTPAVPVTYQTREFAVRAVDAILTVAGLESFDPSQGVDPGDRLVEMAERANDGIASGFYTGSVASVDLTVDYDG